MSLLWIPHQCTVNLSSSYPESYIGYCLGIFSQLLHEAITDPVGTLNMHVLTGKVNRGVAINGVVDRARRRESLSETLLSVRSNAKKKTFRCRTSQMDPYLGEKCLC